MENKRSESDTEDGQSNTFSLDSGIMTRARILPTADFSPGSVIHPINPHYCGYDVVIDVEDAEVEWIPPPVSSLW